MSTKSEALDALLQKQATKFAAVAADKEALARMLAQWVASEWPERVRSAYWVTVDGDADKGFEVTIVEKKVPWWKPLRGSALVGRETWGVAIFQDVAQATINGRDVTASVGLGAVKPYTGGEWKITAAASIRF
jgi:hypothetical protein